MNFMNAARIHMALNHFSVVLTITGFIILMIAMIRSHEVLVKTSFYILLFAGIFCLPAFFSGEGAENIIKNMPGVAENMIETHEDNARIALITSLITAALSLIGLLFYPKAGKMMKNLVIIAALVSGAALAWTAHEGGQIRHPELHKDFTGAAAEGKGDTGIEEQEQHD
jgi:uncharacterized membrane protein